MQDQALRRELMEEIHWLVQAELSVPLGQLAAGGWRVRTWAWWSPEELLAMMQPWCLAKGAFGVAARSVDRGTVVSLVVWRSCRHWPLVFGRKF